MAAADGSSSRSGSGGKKPAKLGNSGPASRSLRAHTWGSTAHLTRVAPLRANWLLNGTLFPLTLYHVRRRREQRTQDEGLWSGLPTVLREYASCRVNPAGKAHDKLHKGKRIDHDHAGDYSRLRHCPADGLGTALLGRLCGRLRGTRPQDREDFYRLLGAYRGVLKALIEYTESAGDSDWARWREERFA